MKCACSLALAICFVTACDPPGAPSGVANQQSLLEARRGVATKLIRKVAAGDPVPEPPSRFFRNVKYRSPAGELAGYVSPSPRDSKKHPAIIWIFGGFGNSIGEIAWEKGPPENDQSGRSFADAGIIMMYPSLRGGNQNPGFIEGFYGEVDDILAAREYLEKQDYIDSNRIYLGGHSTGGTLALLVAASTDRFRGVFSFGPVEDVRGYGSENLPFNLSDQQELELRAPRKWLHAIRSPTFVIEGANGRSNISSLRAMSRSSRNPSIHFHPVKGANHFSVLAPISRLLAQKILGDTGPVSNITLGDQELLEAMRK